MSKKLFDSMFIKFKIWKYTEFFKVFWTYMLYYMIPIVSKFYVKESDRQEKFWISGGFNEDIIMIILLNAIFQMIFSIIDYKYAWQLIRIIYFKYFNKQSNLTQFEANKLYLKKIDFHQKSIQLFILVNLCSLFGCLFPICYPITIISILIIYWLNKYQLIHNGTHQKIKFKRRLKNIIMLLITFNQYLSHSLILLKPDGYFHPIFDPLYFALQVVGCIIFIVKRHWIFPKRIQTHQTNIDIIDSHFHNYLYSQYNPVLNENILRNVSDGEVCQQILEKGAQCRFTRQEQFYNSLQVKLLREIEKTQVSSAQIQPISSAQVQPISSDENENLVEDQDGDEIQVEDQKLLDQYLLQLFQIDLSDKSEQIKNIKQILEKSTGRHYFIFGLNQLYTRLFKQKQARFYLTLTKVQFMELLELIRYWLNYIHLNEIYDIYDLLLKSVTIITIDGKDKITLASQLSDIPLWTKIDTWIELFYFIRVNKIDEKKKQAQSIMEGYFFIEQQLHDQIKKTKNDLILDEINLFISSLQLPTELSTEIIIKIAQKCNDKISIYHLVKLLKQQEQFPNTQSQKLFKSSKEMLTHKSQKYQKKQLNIYENKVIQGCGACLKFLSIHDQPQKLLILNRNFNNQLKNKIKKFYMGNYQVFSEESTHKLRLRLMSQALKLKQFNIDYFEMKTNVGIQIGVDDHENSFDQDKFIRDLIHDDVEQILDIHQDQIQSEELLRYLYFTFEDQEIAYKIFDRMMNLYFKELYINDFSKLKTELFIFERLFSIFLPELSSYLIHQKIDISYCVATWLSTLFSHLFHYSYKSAFLNVIWDLFLAEEWKGFYKVIFFIFSLIQQQILNLEIYEIHLYLIYLMKSELFSIRTEKELIQYIQRFDKSIKEDVSIKKNILSQFRITNRMLMSLQFEYYSFKLKQEKRLNQYINR
ncbi:unnamed protein product [Paramecium sonneborni]|uniref:Rab-GAP TBC domain-containing protein n=1 Tax=Paramecium sonneborni TaxID=65129 RepID=A0A8S1RRB8_9CILI|nr:unnamed protein product [Paramecium sonneborni]